MTFHNAAPLLWAFAHLDTEGEGMGQRTQTGYLFLVNVLFRPALMVVGLLLGAIMADLMTELVMQMFPAIMANSGATSWTGIIKVVAYISAFVIILQMVVSLSFGMIRFVPDQVLGWIGGNMVNSIGAQAEDIAGGATKSAFTGRGTITGAAGNAKQAAQMKKNQAQATQDKKTAFNQTQANHNDLIGSNNAILSALTNGQAGSLQAQGTGGNAAGGIPG